LTACAPQELKLLALSVPFLQDDDDDEVDDGDDDGGEEVPLH